METAGEPITCRAAIVWEVNAPFTIETVEVDVPQKGEVRIKMTSAGVCHSDLHAKEGYWPEATPFPIIFGHEGAGIVESVGEKVTSVKPGDLVVLCFEAYCGKCDFCKDSKTNMCMNQPRTGFQMDGTTRITCRGEPINQMVSVSTFSEYTVTSAYNVVKVNPEADPRGIALAGCAIPTGYGAATQVARVKPGSTCAIWGLGGIGMCVVMGCRDSGASKIIGLDINPKKFDLALELGCTDVLNPEETEDVPKILAEMTNGGVDTCFVATGTISAMEQAFNSSHPFWGKTVVIGLVRSGETMSAGAVDIVYGKKIVGCFYGAYKAKRSIPDLVEKVVKDEIQMEKLISHRVPLDQINEAYDMLIAGESLRTIIDFDMKD